MATRKFETLGIWIGSPAKLPSLRREGIFRFLYQLLKHLAAHPELKFEIWCQQINLARVQELFAPLLEQEGLGGRLAFCTELHLPGGADRSGGLGWRIAAAGVHRMRLAVYAVKELPPAGRAVLAAAAALLALAAILAFLSAGSFGRPPFWVILPFLLLVPLLALRGIRSLLEAFLTRAWDTFKRVTNRLPRTASRFSAADCFLVQNIDMDNALTLDRLKVINLHDLFAAEFAPLFSKSGRDRRLLFQGRKAVRSAAALARQGAFFISNSEHIRRTHALALIPGLGLENTAVVFLPTIVPDGIRQRLRPRAEVLAAFSIPAEFLFYPTHIRPYKNILTLLKAFKVVLDHGRALSLVLTGNLADDAESLAFAQRNGLLQNIILCGEIPETDMYSLYRHAALAVVPTLAESSFPWQALEAMAMETPVVVSRIAVVEERLRHHDLDPGTCGLLMFEPGDENALARLIGQVLDNRAGVVAEQGALRATLLAYDWRQLSDCYYSLFSRLVERAC
jgi:glycosyltransferase involved in cell wall biosynthesis